MARLRCRAGCLLGEKSLQPFDLTIVGASFAGLVCARTAALRGLRVAVIEAKPDAGARLHTTGIMVKEAAEEVDIPAQLTRKVRGVRLYAPSLRSLDLFAPGYYFLATDTAGVLRWLAAEAQRAGVQIYYDLRFTGAEGRDGGWRLAEPPIETRFLLGADGARSRVAKALGLGRNERFLTGVEAEFPLLPEIDDRFLHCFLDSRLAPGYLAWIVPGLGLTQAGLAVRSGDKPDLAGFLDKVGGRFGLAGRQPLGRRAGLIPVGGPVEPLWRPGALLVGDAAGLVSPLTAGGIQLAYRFGRRAAQLVADHLQDGGGEPGRLLERELPRFRTKHLLRRGLDLAPPAAMIETALRFGVTRRLAQEIFFHRRGSDDPEAYERFLESQRKGGPAYGNGG